MDSKRPYSRQASMTGLIASLDMGIRIKRKDVDEAVKTMRMSQTRQIGADILKPSRDLESNFLLRFSPEIRNQIYAHALCIESNTALNTWVVGSKHMQESPSISTALFQLCKKITVEARSMLEARAISYIPIMADMNFNELIVRDQTSFSSTQSTIFASLTSFTNAHIHLHVHHAPFPDPAYWVPRLDLRNRYIYAVLRQALIIWCSASKNNFSQLVKDGLKRKAVVHLDHLLSDWTRMVNLGGPYDLYHVLCIMGEDTTTEWELHYYIHAGGWLSNDDPELLDMMLTQTLDLQEKACANFTNIKLVGEIYGKHLCSFEDRETVTRDITPSSRLWPSWPEDVPWRVFPRVRLDEAVPGLLVTEDAA